MRSLSKRGGRRSWKGRWGVSIIGLFPRRQARSASGRVVAVGTSANFKTTSRAAGLLLREGGGRAPPRLADPRGVPQVARRGGRPGVHVHLFRHCYTTNFLNCVGRLDALQEQLGYRDINTTRIYLRLTSEDGCARSQRYSSSCFQPVWYRPCRRARPPHPSLGGKGLLC